MTVPYRKKLIEVALPLEAINAASAREKSIRHGHPSTLHLWWARRPLAACRAVLFASLVDDPSSDPSFGGDEEIEATKRAELFNLIEELVQWQNSNNPRVINKARAEIARCIASRKIETRELKKGQAISLPKEEGDKAARKYTPQDITRMLAPPEAVNHFLANYGPPVLDPFCGGGSIPLEAQRLGLRAYASDLNPVAVLITKALIEIPPKFAGMPPVNPDWQKKSREEKAATVWEGAQGLAEDVRHYGKWMRDEAERRIGHLYPKVKVTKKMAKDRPDLKEYVGQELTVIAWLWARTIECPNPACRLVLPLVKSFALCAKASRPKRLAAHITKSSRTVKFSIDAGKSDSRAGNVDRSGAKCIACHTRIPFSYIRDEGQRKRIGNQLLAVICKGRHGRVYISASRAHEVTALSTKATWMPDVDIPNNPFSLRPPLYGFTRFSDLFNDRQLAGMNAFIDSLHSLRDTICTEPHLADYSHAIQVYLALCVSRLANRCSNACFWDPGGENVQQVFARQAIAMTWDYIEANPLGDATGSFLNQVEYLARVVSASPLHSCSGVVRQCDATQLDESDFLGTIATDPPYYDNIDYADLSDFFYVWLRRGLFECHPDLFRTVLVPKREELVATPYRYNGDQDAADSHFRGGLRRALAGICARNAPDTPATVIYAFKQEEDDEVNGRSSTGWESFLQSAADVGLRITGTWPLRTELVGNLKGKMNVLATSIALACRKRDVDAAIATRKELLGALRTELPSALRKLQNSNVAAVDLAQAAIGPGMAVFTRYSKVIESDGSPMSVRTALGLINQTLDETLAEQEGHFDTDTRWALAWFDQFGMDEGPFGVAETLSKAKNTAVRGLVEAGVVRARGGKVQLLKRQEMPADWEPGKDKRLTIWEVTQHLIRTLDQKGELAAAVLLHKLGALGETARDLAYRLYTICERKKWAEEALAYNGLVIAWPELTKLARAERTRSRETQSRMFQ